MRKDDVIMKKRYLAIFFALIIVLTSIPVFAAGAGTLTIENATIGKTYSAYKIFDATHSGNAYSYSIAESNPWYNEIAGDSSSPFELEKIETSTDKYNVSVKDEAEAFSWLQAKAAAIENGSLAIAADALETAVTTRIEFTELVYGYYFISSELGSVVTISNFVENAQIIDKNQEPVLTGKEVSASCDEDSWGSSCTAGIDDIVYFRIKAFVPKYHEDKKVYRYTFTDELDPGLTYKADSIELKIGNTTLVNPDNYTVEILDQKITITLKAQESGGYPTDATVEISYSAIVNEEAQHENTNSVSMTWTEFDPETNPNDPDNLSSPGPENLPPTALTTTYVCGFDLHKYKEEALPGNTLEGAEFRLYNAADNGEEIKMVKTEEGKYRVALDSEEGVKITAGEARIFGLDTGTYWLEETRAPNGYNQLTARVLVEISDENTTNGYLTDSIKIVNKAGITLPATGGIGSYIFYLTGSVLMLAVVLFLFKKAKRTFTKKAR